MLLEKPYHRLLSIYFSMEKDVLRFYTPEALVQSNAIFTMLARFDGSL